MIRVPLALLGAVALIVAAARRPPVEISLELPHAVFFAGETIDLGLGVRNTSAVAIDPGHPLHRASQKPVFHLHGPAGLRTFTPATAPLRGHGAASGPAAPFPIAPGQARSTQIPLGAWADLSQPGRYRLTAELDGAQSQAVEFEIHALAPKQVSLVVDEPPSVRAMFTAEDYLFEQSFTEERPDLGLMKTSVLRRVGQAGAEAAEPFSPPKRPADASALSMWNGQREGETVVAHELMGPPQRLHVAGLRRLLLPAQLAAEDLSLLAELTGPPRLVPVRFPMPADGAAAPAIGEELRLAGPLFAAQTLGAERAAVASIVDGVLLLQLFLRGELHGAVRAPGALASGAMTIGARTEPSGAVSAALVYQRPGKARDGSPQVTLTLLESSFAAGGEPAGPPSLTDLVTLPVPAAATAASFGPRGVEWVALLASGELVSSLRRTPARAGRPAVLPLALLARAQATYLLVTGAQGLALEPLR